MSVKIRPKSLSCIVCGEGSVRRLDEASLEGYNYATFTGMEPRDGAPTPLALIPGNERLTPHEALVRQRDASAQPEQPVQTVNDTQAVVDAMFSTSCCQITIIAKQSTINGPLGLYQHHSPATGRTLGKATQHFPFLPQQALDRVNCPM
eukprot:352562-Chlamydomonas_euryale.AAC.8